MPASVLGFDYRPRTRLVFGLHTIDRLGELARGIGGERALIVTDAGLVAAGHVDHARASLEAAGFEVSVFAGLHENPTTRDVDLCLEAARESGTELFVGLGGGSSLDTAKG